MISLTFQAILHYNTAIKYLVRCLTSIIGTKRSNRTQNCHRFGLLNNLVFCFAFNKCMQIQTPAFSEYDCVCVCPASGFGGHDCSVEADPCSAGVCSDHTLHCAEASDGRSVRCQCERGKLRSPSRRTMRLAFTCE